MDWYALRTRDDERVLADLTEAGIRAFRAMYTREWWSARRSRTMTRTEPLIPGLLLVGQPVVPLGITRYWHEFLSDHVSGRPLRVPEADDLISRCERGEFDLRKDEPGHFDKGSRVRVVVLGLEGVVDIRYSKHRFQVLLDIGRTVEVRLPGLEAA